MGSFVSELKRRNVFRVATAYALVAWILIEAGSVLLPTFGAPDWFFKVYVIFVAAGFVLALIAAWIFEITPDGVRLERDIDRSNYESNTGAGKNYLIIGLLVVALGVSITFNLTGMRDDSPQSGDVFKHNSVAVLPFDSRSSNTENRYFADGIHDDILTRLAEIKSLRVISRTSVNEYRDTNRNLRKIGEELGVTAIVEGAVQRSGDMVRITVQLIDAATDEHIWAKTFDRKLTITSLFELQSEISSEIASSLRAALTPEQEYRLAAIPTNSLAAYAEYVAGRENLLQRKFDTLITAREKFERAIELDPNYGQAHAALAETVLVILANHKSIPRGDALSIASTHIDKALLIDPEMPQGYAVRGLLEMTQWERTHVGTGNLAAAASFERAIQLNPNLTDAYVWFASLRSAEGDFEKSIELLSIAMTIDPLNRIPYLNLPRFLADEGKNARTTELLLRATRIFPDWPMPYNYLANHMQGLGRLDEAIAWGQREITLSEDPMTGGSLLGIYQDFGDDDAIAAFMEAFPKDHPLYPVGKSFWFYLKRDYEAALLEVSRYADDPAFPQDFTYPLVIGAAIMTGDLERAYEYLIKSSPGLIKDAENTVTRFNTQLAVLLAYVEQQRNHPQVATNLLRQAAAIVHEMPRLGMSGYGIRDVQILTLQGRKEEAIAVLAQAVEEGFVSSQSFDGWPFDENPLIDPLRRDPRFEALTQRINQRLEEMRKNVDKARESGDWSALLAKAASA